MNLIKIKEPMSSKNDAKICLGIDFGTTNSVCSVKVKDKFQFILDDNGKTLIPTLILYSEKTKKFGNQIIKNESYFNSIFSVKRNFTKDFDKKIYEDENGAKISSMEVSKDFFIYLKNLCEKNLNQNVFDCVITVPAYFDEKARSGIMRAAFMAGLRVRRLINEPTAAAFAYGLEKKKKGIFFVYDLGGGTFDVSLLKLSDGIFKVIATSGDPNLGGDDFDILYAKWLVKKYFKIDFDSLNKKEKLKLVKKSKLLKEKLFETQTFNEKLKVNECVKEIEINIKDFNKAINNLIDRTIKISLELLNEVDVEINKIEGFVLVGGSSRIKCISEKIKENFETTIFDDVNPDLVVSKGAALHGYELLNGSDNVLLDVTPLSLGIETMGGLMEKIISRNTPIPAIKEQTFTTHENGQTAIKFLILQGERETSSNNRKLGEFILSNIQPKPAGIPRITVMFSLDADGILFVTAKDEETGIQNKLSVKTNDDLDLNDMRKIVESSIENAKDDIHQRMVIEAKVKAKSFLNEIESVKKDIELLCSKNDINDIENNVNLLKKSLETNDCDMINQNIEKLNKATESFAQKRIEKDFSQVIGKDVDKID